MTPARPIGSGLDLERQGRGGRPVAVEVGLGHAERVEAGGGPGGEGGAVGGAQGPVAEASAARTPSQTPACSGLIASPASQSITRARSGQRPSSWGPPARDRAVDRRGSIPARQGSTASFPAASLSGAPGGLVAGR